MFISWEFLFDQLTVYLLALYQTLEIGAVLVLIQLYKNIFKKIFFFCVNLTKIFSLLSLKFVSSIFYRENKICYLYKICHTSKIKKSAFILTLTTRQFLQLNFVNKKNYSTLAKGENLNNQLNPSFVTGFADAECSLTIKIQKDFRNKIG
jgi:hypothetical protein